MLSTVLKEALSFIFHTGDNAKIIHNICMRHLKNTQVGFILYFY